jgi:hypothetical protein
MTACAKVEISTANADDPFFFLLSVLIRVNPWLNILVFSAQRVILQRIYKEHFQLARLVKYSFVKRFDFK